MRLNERQIQTIREEVNKQFGNECTILLFGSRVDDEKRGGDIDLLIQTAGDNLFEKKIKAISNIQLKLGERKIDMVIDSIQEDDSRKPYIVQVARETGVVLS